jgi:hypothetical protein
MKKLMPIIILSFFLFLSCASKKNLAEITSAKKTYHFVVFPFKVEPSLVKGSEDAVISLQEAFIKQITLTNNTVTDSKTFLNQMNNLNLTNNNLNDERIITVGKALNAEIGIWGNVDYRTGPESNKVDSDFKLMINAIDIKTGKVTWQKRSGKIFNWHMSSETVSRNIATSFLDEFLY